MESLKRALEQIGRLWANLTATQRVLLGASAGAMVLLLIFGSTAAAPSWVRVPVSEADRGSILKKLQERGQKHDIRGSEIFVPKEDADRIVMELRGEGSMSDDSFLKFLDQPNILATRWDKEKRLQFAVQTRIESMIRSIESVQDARLMINPGSASYANGFFGAKPSAAVTVKLKDGMQLNQKNVQAIAGLVARSVTGVEEDQVHIVDGRGNSYRARKMDDRSADVADIREYERSQEERIAADIRGAFSRITSAGISVVVRIKANSKSSQSVAETHDKPTVIESNEKRKTIKKGGSSTGGVRKGEESPTQEPAPGGDEIETENHEKSVVGSKKTTEFNPAGDIERITVGVLIPVEEGPRFVEAEKSLPGLRKFVLAAAQAREEDVSVQLLPTKPVDVAVGPVDDTSRALVWLWANWQKVLLATLALVALVVIVRVIQISSAKDTVEELQALTTALTETGAAEAELAAPGEGDLGKIKQGLRDMVGRNPQGVAASLKSFMSGR